MVIRLKNYRTTEVSVESVEMELTALENAVIALESLQNDSSVSKDLMGNNGAISIESVTKGFVEAVKAMWEKFLELLSRLVKWAKTADPVGMIREAKRRIVEIAKRIPELRKLKRLSKKERLAYLYRKSSKYGPEGVLSLLAKNEFDKNDFIELVRKEAVGMPESFKGEDVEFPSAVDENKYFDLLAKVKKSPSVSNIEKLLEYREKLRRKDTVMAAHSFQLNDLLTTLKKASDEILPQNDTRIEWIEAIKAADDNFEDADVSRFYNHAIKFGLHLGKHVENTELLERLQLPQLATPLHGMTSELKQKMTDLPEADYSSMDEVKTHFPKVVDFLSKLVSEDLMGTTVDEVAHEIKDEIFIEDTRKYISADSNAFKSVLAQLNDSLVTSDALTKAPYLYDTDLLLGNDAVDALQAIEKAVQQHLQTLSDANGKGLYPVTKLIQKTLLDLLKFQNGCAITYKHLAEAYQGLIDSVYKSESIAV